MTKVTARFENQKVYVGIDVHKRSWNAGIYLNEQFIRNVAFPDFEALPLLGQLVYFM